MSRWLATGVGASFGAGCRKRLGSGFLGETERGRLRGLTRIFLDDLGGDGGNGDTARVLRVALAAKRKASRRTLAAFFGFPWCSVVKPVECLVGV